MFKRSPVRMRRPEESIWFWAKPAPPPSQQQKTTPQQIRTALLLVDTDGRTQNFMGVIYSRMTVRTMTDFRVGRMARRD